MIPTRPDFPATIGICSIESKSILTPTRGFLSKFTHTINPYSGCIYGCSYCYVPKGFELAYGTWGKENWGQWVYPKKNAAFLLRASLRKLARQHALKSTYVYFGSVTDCYQPIEKIYRITRSLLQIFLDFPVGYINIQTRSPLVIQDIPLLKKLSDKMHGCLSVCITLTTNREEVRKRFEPKSASLKARRYTLEKLKSNNLDTQASISPLLPCDPEDFAKQVNPLVTRAVFDNIILDESCKRSILTGNRFSQSFIGACTRDNFFDLVQNDEWNTYFTKDFYYKVINIFKQELGNDRTFKGEAGFHQGLNTHIQPQKKHKQKNLESFFEHD